MQRSLLARNCTKTYSRLQSGREFASSSWIRENARPATAPKQFPDLRTIRANPDLYSDNCHLRHYNAHIATPQRVIELNEQAKQLEGHLREPRAWIKEASKKLGPSAIRTLNTQERQTLLEAISKVKGEIEDLERKKVLCDTEAADLALRLPNLTSERTPRTEPTLLGYINYDDKTAPEFSSAADHSLIGKELSLLDFTASATTSGWGFYYLLNEAALLEQALVQYALQVLSRRGWQIVSPPSLVYSHMANACGFQPRDANDEQQIWQVATTERDAGKPSRSLAATAEIPLAGMHANSAVPVDHLPMKVAGSSRCYRAEAGARGVDTKGLYRVHEFTKVEMFAWTAAGSWTPVQSSEDPPATTVFDEMVDIQQEILMSLGLPCRILEMPSSDLGASAYRKIDIEALFPSRRNRDGGWGEVTSASICTDYQTRRLDTRILEKSGGRSTFAHTVNGTAIAIPRVLAALLEHGWRDAERCVVIPEVLRPYMGGQERIGPK